MNFYEVAILSWLYRNPGASISETVYGSRQMIDADYNQECLFLNALDNLRITRLVYEEDNVLFLTNKGKKEPMKRLSIMGRFLDSAVYPHAYL